MNTKDEAFIKKAKELIKKYQDEFSENAYGYFDFKDPRAELFHELKMDMIHLIYSYDPDIPAFGKLKGIATAGGVLKMEDIQKCLKYVIHYINDIKVK